MPLLKKCVIIYLVIFAQISFANICVNTSSNYKMFGSVLRAGALFRGHQLAFQDNHFTDYQIFSAENDDELAKQIQSTSTSSCSIILGLFTSRDCLIAGPILKKNKRVGVSASCGPDKLQQFSPYLYTIIPPINAFSEKTAEYLKRRNDLGEVFIIYQPTDVYSVISLQEFKKHFQRENNAVSVESDGQLDINIFSSYQGKRKTLVFLTYPLPSAQILMKLSDKNIIDSNTKIVGASAWTFDVSVFQPIRSILEKAQDVVAADILNWEQVKKSAFTREFYAKYNRTPFNIEIMTYDVTQLAIHCYNHALTNKKYDTAKFQNCMINTTHKGVSGEFNFKSHSPYAARPVYLTHLLSRM